MRYILLSVVLSLSVFAVAQTQHCDSIVIAKEKLVPSFLKDSSNLVLFYKKGDLLIKIPKTELLKSYKLMGMTEKEVSNKMNLIKSMNIERDSQIFRFSPNAESMVCTFLYYRTCYVSIGEQVLKEYLALGYQSKNCTKYSRYIFNTEYYVERSYVE